MDEAKKVVDQWTMGLGIPEGGPRYEHLQHLPRRRALRGDWSTRPMPLSRAEIELDLPITDAEFDVLAMGHLPLAMEDHWFMYFDGASLCFHRSWTGICIYQVHVAHGEGGAGYVLTSVTANRDQGQYGETSDERDRLLATILVGEQLGRDVSGLWEAFHSAQEDPVPTESAQVLSFWNADEPLGSLSNWHDAGFELFGRRFATSEHWLMWQKARAMEDWKSADAILAASSPKEAKALGASVSPYDDHLWRSVREELTYVGVREKFLQNPALARELLATGTTVLAEASPTDRVWGVGIAADAPGFADMTGWRGDNLQGRVCMRVRSDLRLAQSSGLDLDHAAGQGGTERADLEAMLRSGLGTRSLLSLARDPLTRPAALCCASVIQHAARKHYHSVHALLMDFGKQSLRDIDKIAKMGQDGDAMLPGWGELLVQLAFLRRVGLL